MSKFLLAIGAILFMVGVKLVFDARPLVKTYFSFGNENEATLGMKILGFLIIVLAGILIKMFI